MQQTHASSAYTYPLLIKQLWHTPMSCHQDQEIVSGLDDRRFTYRELRERIGRLAAGLESIGVKPGDTVAVMDWDNHRYLECFFGVPMMAAGLVRIGEAADRIAAGEGDRAVATATQGACMQQNLVCVLEGE